MGFKISKILLTWFGCGYVPIAPGTAGSLGALPLCWALSCYTGVGTRVGIAAIATVTAVFLAAQDQKRNLDPDPQYIVLDEVIGMLWSTLFIPPTWLALFIAFGLFRLLDVIKPFPANRFDQLSKKATKPLGRGFGIVFDDVTAGLFVALILKLLI